jgi:ketosteroid isomerase-like protein
MSFWHSFVQQRQRRRAEADAARQEIEAAITAANEAMNRRDIEGILFYTTPDYHTISVTGEVETRDAMRQTLEHAFERAEELQWQTTLTRFSYHGDRATVETFERHDGIVAQEPGGARHAVRVERVCEDSWVRTSEGWKIYRCKALWENPMSFPLEPDND